MSISEDQVRHVADLAHIAIDPTDAAQLAHELGRILDLVASLNRLDTTGVEPTAHVLDLTGVMREDEPQPSLPRDEALAAAPAREGAYFLVPRVVELGG
ncbi:MAG: Asp-tRNA(Asn)/Glu-tRNA(Gln) amidotransferase subunit GatC [Clostridia bacterium]|nr:Asp-tRNA(Asn)/Glu-tRNA(Gln) amidotransferase subunit GatC [Clostridia bacterium]